MNRLIKKFESAKNLVPRPDFYQETNQSDTGIIFFGTTRYAAEEALDILESQGRKTDAIRIKAIPFHHDVADFIDNHDVIFVIEQNRDAQMRALLINELDIHPKKLIKVLNFDGTPITADFILQQINQTETITA